MPRSAQPEMSWSSDPPKPPSASDTGSTVSYVKACSNHQYSDAKRSATTAPRRTSGTSFGKPQRRPSTSYAPGATNRPVRGAIPVVRTVEPPRHLTETIAAWPPLGLTQEETAPTDTYLSTSAPPRPVHAWSMARGRKTTTTTAPNARRGCSSPRRDHTCWSTPWRPDITLRTLKLTGYRRHCISSTRSQKEGDMLSCPEKSGSTPPKDIVSLCHTTGAL